MRNAITVVLLAMLASMPVGARDKEGKAASYGGVPCSKYTAQRTADSWESLALMAWVAGYFTAINRVLPDTFNVLGDSDMDSAMLWLDNYCKSNPSSSLSDGVAKLGNDLYPKRHRTAKDAGR